MDLGLKGKVAIITGGSHGIGRGAAEAMAKEGARVVLAARDQADLDRVSEEISQATGAEVIGISTDVTVESQVKSLVAKVVERWGRVDILVNNAGTGNANPFDAVTDELLMSDLQIKVFGAMYCMRAVLPHMKAAGGGAVVNITTPAGKAPGGPSQPTALSRAAGISLTKAWSKEFAPFNIRVNTVCIGSIKSRQNYRQWERRHAQDPSFTLEDYWTERSKPIPMGRGGEPNEAGEPIAFLCSERASYVTGTSINVDGGISPVT
jgi:NAD(P)-dependent dehydrogenase (short-subunit alcohol dehydrogenase family)